MLHTQVGHITNPRLTRHRAPGQSHPLCLTFLICEMEIITPLSLESIKRVNAYKALYHGPHNVPNLTKSKNKMLSFLLLPTGILTILIYYF